MSKILVCVSNAVLDDNEYKHFCFYEQFCEELAHHGNEVLVLIPNEFNDAISRSYNVLKANVLEETLHTDIINFNPDLVIAFNYATYYKLLEIVNCKIVIWAADYPWLWNQTDVISQNLDRFEFFSFTENGIPLIKNSFKINDNQCHYVPQATNLKPCSYEQDINISFIGTCYETPSEFSELMRKHCGDDELINIIKSIYDNPFISQNELKSIPTKASLKDDIAKLNPNLYIHYFAGFTRMMTLANICDLGLKIYGDYVWKNLNGHLAPLMAYFNDVHIYSKQHNEGIYNRSKVCINIMHPQSTDGMPWRVLDVLATNGCLLTQKSAFIEEKFAKYVKLPCFEDYYDVRNVCKKLLDEENWRKDIVAAAQEAIEKEWRWELRFKQMEDILGIPIVSNPNKQGYCKHLTPQYIKEVDAVANQIAENVEPAFENRLGIRGRIGQKIDRICAHSKGLLVELFFIDKIKKMLSK